MKLLFTLLSLLCLIIPSLNGLTVSFSRRLDTCDSQDQPITDGTTKLIYAYSSINPNQTGGQPSYHQQKGTRSARITEGKPVKPDIPADARTISLQVNNLAVPFPQDDPTTSYYCTIFALNVTSKAHIIQWEPVFQPKQNVKFVHHILVYECDAAAAHVGYSGLCFDPNFNYTACQNNNILSAWAVGGGAFNYPSDIGYPIGTSNTVRYVMMETHYNNVDPVPVVDSSGMKYTVITDHLRPIEAGILITGYNTDPRFTIAPGISDSPFLAPCPSQCTQTIFPQPVKILATLLHMHTAGKAMKLRQIRNGTELPVILSDSYYDFNFQDFEYMSTPRDVYPGDEFITECHYDTTSRKNVTHFGLSTRQEMCLAFSIVYPRNNQLLGCSFGNYTQFHYPTDPPEMRFPAAFCGTNTTVMNVTLPNITTPLPPNNCTHSIPDTIAPRISDFSTLDTSSYERQLYLDDNQQVLLWWNVDRVKQMIHFVMDVQTDGWMGLGFSPNAAMANSDIITFWQSNNTLHVEDRVAVKQFLGHALPDMDIYQDIVNVQFYTNLLPSPSSDSSSHLSTPIMIAIIVGGVVIVGLIIGACCYRHKQKNDAYHTLLAEDRVNYTR